MNKHSIAIIGAGAMGKAHAEAWKSAGAGIGSVTDTDLGRAKELAAEHGAQRVHSDYRPACSDGDIDIVAVCTPLAFHAPVTIYAAKQGKHVFCEKPMTQTAEDALEMERAIKKAGVQFGIGFQRSISKDVELLREWIAEKMFGSHIVINIDTMAEVRSKIAMHDADGNMGPVMDVASHEFVMWHNVLQSRAQTVFAMGRTLATGRPELEQIKRLAIDTALITIKYENGALLQYNISWGLEKNSTIPSHRTRIYGSRGGAEIKPHDTITVYKDGKNEVVHIDQPNSYLRQNQNRLFLEALDSGQDAPVGLRQGKETLAVSLAALRSISSGQPEIVEYF